MTDMGFDASQFLMLLQWMDSAFPTGAFAHSGGLETYTQAALVRSASDLAAMLAIKLESAATTDLIVVHSAMSAYADADHEQIVYLDTLCAASKVARETRESSEKIGRRMLTSVLNLMSDPILLFFRDAVAEGRCYGHHAVAFGLACATLGIEKRAALLAFGYALASNQTAASVKLMSIGQTQAQAVLGASGAAVQAAVDKALARTLDDFGAFMPGLDIRAMQHEHLFRRLFIS